MRRWPGFIVVLMLVAFAPDVDASRPGIAIIIDDLGNALGVGQRAIDLPGPLAVAVLPGTPRARQLATLAHVRGKEVLLHLPLQAEKDSGDPAPGSLVLDMSHAKFQEALAKAIESVPYIVGINTHRGSLLTRHPGHMRWLMDEIRARGDLFFVDSYTTVHSVALRIARESGVPAVKRDVFLDPDSSADTVPREFRRLMKIARQQGYAVGIGHPYPATLDFLEQALPSLGDEGFELLRIGDLVAAASARAGQNESVSGE